MCEGIKRWDGRLKKGVGTQEIVSGIDLNMGGTGHPGRH